MQLITALLNIALGSTKPQTVNSRGVKLNFDGRKIIIVSKTETREYLFCPLETMIEKKPLD